MSKRLFFLFLFFTLSLTNPAIAKFPPKPAATTIQGKVTDLNTKAPIPEAEVVLLDSSRRIIASSLTNPLGEYRIKATIPSGYYSLRVSKEGYISRTLGRLLQEGKTYNINFSLKSINRPPKIIRIEPKNNSTFLAGADIKIQVYAFDPNRDPLEYQFSIGGAIKQTWSSSNTYTWQTSEADTGAVDIACEVRDNKGGNDAKTITYHLINPTVEEILQKVVDNYAKIYDFKADMTLSSTLNGQPFGQTEYCRYYFKAPNKEKTETYSDSYRTIKTDIIIINGSNMHLIDPVNNIKQQVDLLADVGIDAAQFNQMDLYYNLPNFLNNHIVTKSNEKTDFNNMIIALDAIPKEPNNLYSKLELYIDYKKGLLMKIVHCRNEELPQIMEAIETEQMANGVWLVSKVRKNPNFTAGGFIATLSYDNIQINTGLTDLDFDPSKQY